MNKKKGLHYGWVVCFCATFIFFINVGFTNSAFGVHLPYIMNALGCTNAEASLIVSVRTAATLLALFLADVYIGKLGIKRGLELALVIGAAGFLCFAFAGSLPVYYAGGFCMGLASGLGGFMVLSILLHEWFTDCLGLAIGICAAGSGVALIVLPPILTKLIDSIGLNNAYLVEAGFESLALVVSFIFISGSPQEKNLTSYVSDKKSDVLKKTMHSGIDVLGNRGLLAVMFLVQIFIGVSGLTCTFFPLLYTGLGYSEAAAANLYSAIGVVLIAAKISMGRLNDKIGACKTSLLAFAFMTISCVLLCFAGKHSAFINISAVAFQGFGQVITTIVISNLAEDLSSDESYTKLIKYMNIFYFLGILIGSYLLGLLADITGNYIASFALCGGLAFVSLILIIIVYKTGRKMMKENDQ